ncbi:MAG: hypothetical protein GY909_17125 [Oligoflexia bacterium]|nr:hypothetical protein [Oligoflexia bacterium]
MKATRIAPTPNGHYHLGNIYNFLYTAWWASENLAHLFLRIDDHDPDRSQDIYIEEAIEVLELFEIDYQGPKSLSEFKKTYSQQLKLEHYREQLEIFKDKFCCICSRKDYGSLYQGKCVDAGLSFESGKTCIRFSNKEFHFPILWRKEDIPSYQWASLIDDIDLKITHLIRGKDLKESSEIQKALAKGAGLSFIESSHFYHHDLLLEGEKKLSKSRKSEGIIKELRSTQSRKEIIRDFSLLNCAKPHESLGELFKEKFPLKSDT